MHSDPRTRLRLGHPSTRRSPLKDSCQTLSGLANERLPRRPLSGRSTLRPRFPARRNKRDGDIRCCRLRRLPVPAGRIPADHDRSSPRRLEWPMFGHPCATTSTPRSSRVSTPTTQRTDASRSSRREEIPGTRFSTGQTEVVQDTRAVPTEHWCRRFLPTRPVSWCRRARSTERRRRAFAFLET